MRVTKKQIRSLVEQINFDLDILDPAREVVPEATEALEQWMATVGIATLRDCESGDGSGIEFNNKHYDLRCVVAKMRESSQGEVVGGLRQDLGSILRRENKMTLTKNELRQMILSELLNERRGPLDWAEDKMGDLGGWVEDRVEDVQDWAEEEILEPTRDAICDIADDQLDDWRRDLERWIRRNADEISEMCPWGTQWACEDLVESGADEIARCMVAVLTPDMCR